MIPLCFMQGVVVDESRGQAEMVPSPWSNPSPRAGPRSPPRARAAGRTWAARPRPGPRAASSTRAAAGRRSPVGGRMHSRARGGLPSARPAPSRYRWPARRVLAVVRPGLAGRQLLGSQLLTSLATATAAISIEDPRITVPPAPARRQLQAVRILQARAASLRTSRTVRNSSRGTAGRSAQGSIPGRRSTRAPLKCTSARSNLS